MLFASKPLMDSIIDQLPPSSELTRLFRLEATEKQVKSVRVIFAAIFLWSFSKVIGFNKDADWMTPYILSSYVIEYTTR